MIDVSLDDAGQNGSTTNQTPQTRLSVSQPSIWEITANRRIFPHDESALKSIFLAIKNVSKRWKQIHHWKPALQVFQIVFGEERLPLSAMQ